VRFRFNCTVALSMKLRESKNERIEVRHTTFNKIKWLIGCGATLSLAQSRAPLRTLQRIQLRSNPDECEPASFNQAPAPIFT
jgi:hypothetical protein